MEFYGLRTVENRSEDYKIGVGVGLSYPPGQQKIRCVAMNLSEVENVGAEVGCVGGNGSGRCRSGIRWGRW